MKYFYISSFDDKSGICRYSRLFYNCVLKERGYEFVDSKTDLSEVFTRISSVDYVHIEIGLFREKEVEILFLMLKAGYKSVVVTLHDPPFVKYPMRDFGNGWMNKLSGLYDVYLARFGNVVEYVKKIKTVYVLSHKGVRMLRSLFNVDNVYFLPHLVSGIFRESEGAFNCNFVYMGFIGRNKGIEYSLKLHKALLDSGVPSEFYIIGTAIGKQLQYLEELKMRYTQGVHFLGYLDDEEMDEVFEKATFAVSLFKDYRFYYPMSGSILHNLSRGKIVLTNPVNCIPEIISDKSNGFFLSMELKKDLETLKQLFSNQNMLGEVLHRQRQYLLKYHDREIVRLYLRDGVAAQTV